MERVSFGSSRKRLWKDFRHLIFTGLSVSISPKPDLLFHIKLYAFATKYLIDPLREQCVKWLHRDLCDFSLDKDSASQIPDLLAFTYANTGRADPGGAPSLRDLVIHYVACKGRTLADDERFYHFPDSNGEMGSDFVAKLL